MSDPSGNLSRIKVEDQMSGSQLEFRLPTRGGRRDGAGRKPKGPRALVSHDPRPRFERVCALQGSRLRFTSGRMAMEGTAWTSEAAGTASSAARSASSLEVGRAAGLKNRYQATPGAAASKPTPPSTAASRAPLRPGAGPVRSEESRVGEECRSRW